MGEAIGVFDSKGGQASRSVMCESQRRPRFVKTKPKPAPQILTIIARRPFQYVQLRRGSPANSSGRSGRTEGTSGLIGMPLTGLAKLAECNQSLTQSRNFYT
jgi:hypothetical protein